MDPVTNPYAPGAGTPPPELAGRDGVRETVRIALERARIGNSAKSVLMVGLRGVGKTVLLDRMRDDAEAAGITVLRTEAPENRSLPSILAPQLRQALLRLSLEAKAKKLAERALVALAGFIGAFKAKYQDVEVRLDMKPQRGLADSGSLDQDLQSLLEATGEACRKADSALAIFIDELQYVEESQLAALIMALHRSAQQRLPAVLVGAGLPQLRARMGKAKSYAERLFEFPEIGPLSASDAEQALVKPARERKVRYDSSAIERILKETRCYPYFLQEWAKHSWDVAARSPISRSDVDKATILAVARLDESFFRVRFDRSTQSERIYLRAMAELGPGPHRSGDVAQVLNRKVTSLGPVRNKLIAKGMVYSPGHGDTAFTVPMFDEFMRRIMPDRDWMKE